MNDAALARLEHENYAAAGWRFCSAVDGARVERRDGVLVALTGLPLLLFNQIIVESDDASADVVSDSIEIARGRRDRFMVTLRAGTDDRLEPRLRDLGLVRLSAEPWMPGMAMHPATTGSRRRTVATRSGCHGRRWRRRPRRAAAEGFGIAERVVAAIVNADTWPRPRCPCMSATRTASPSAAGSGC